MVVVYGFQVIPDYDYDGGGYGVVRKKIMFQIYIEVFKDFSGTLNIWSGMAIEFLIFVWLHQGLALNQSFCIDYDDVL